MARLLIIGQAPGSDEQNEDPLTGPSGRRLSEVMGASFDAYREMTERVNLLDRYYGSNGKGDAFPEREARRAGVEMLSRLRDSGRRVLIVGKGVAGAMGLADAPLLEWFEVGGYGFHAMIVPHTSGVNRWWNDDANRRGATLALRRVGRAIMAGASNKRRCLKCQRKSRAKQSQSSTR